MKPLGLLSNFILLVKKKVRQRGFHIFSRKFFIVVPLAVQNSLAFSDGFVEIVGNVRFVRIQTIRILNFLTVDVHFNIGKTWVQNVIYMINEKSWSLLCCLFLFSFSLFFVLLFYFFGIVSFVTTTPDKFQFQSQLRLSQINIIVPIRLKFKLYAVFIEWSSRIKFLIKRQKDIIKYWNFPSGISGICQKV